MDKSNKSVFGQTVSEADVDWIICIELNSSPEFRQWLFGKVFGLNIPFTSLGAWRSVADAYGESDLLWLVGIGNAHRCMVMIENKIKAAAQPDQYERYITRGEGYANDDTCDSYIATLCAPAKYVSADSEEYAVRIAYEEIQEWFLSRSGERATYLASLMERGVKKLGEKAPPDPLITEFRRRIWKIADAEFPELTVLRPTGVSSEEYWVYMRYAGFQMIYKMYRKAFKYGDCVVDLELAGRANELGALRDAYAEDLARHGFDLVKTTKSVSFRQRVPRNSPVDFDEEATREALRAASELLAWWRAKGEAKLAVFDKE